MEDEKKGGEGEKTPVDGIMGGTPGGVKREKKGFEKDSTVSRLRKEQEKEYQLINNLLGEINCYMLQNLDRAEKETRVTSLPLDEPLKPFTLQTLRLSSVSDKRIATILEAVREKVIDIINNRVKMIQTYQAIKECVLVSFHAFTFLSMYSL
ncbi:hypothetical protein Tco_0291706 [Tanacetum coccineum]